MPSNTELVRNAFAAVDANDLEALLPMLHEDVEFHSLTGKGKIAHIEGFTDRAEARAAFDRD